jgi:hypothetical protein
MDSFGWEVAVWRFATGGKHVTASAAIRAAIEV